MDLRANIPQDLIIHPFERILVHTGIFIAIPSGYEAQIRPRSGLSLKKGLTLINAVGTIDCDYRGEIMVPMVNLSQEPQVIQDGERIAQIIFNKYEVAEWNEVKELDQTNRGNNGFGHSGNN
jgi:dUTP pyrophosphatase